MLIIRVHKAVNYRIKNFNKFSTKVSNKMIMKNQIQMLQLKLLTKINDDYKN